MEDKKSSRVIGTKVSQIANMFQPKLMHDEIITNRVKVTAQPLAEKKEAEPKATVTRTESQAARFNNARALFEKLGEENRNVKERIVIQTSRSATNIYDVRSRSSSANSECNQTKSHDGSRSPSPIRKNFDPLPTLADTTNLNKVYKPHDTSIKYANERRDVNNWVDIDQKEYRSENEWKDYRTDNERRDYKSDTERKDRRSDNERKDHRSDRERKDYRSDKERKDHRGEYERRGSRNENQWKDYKTDSERTDRGSFEKKEMRVDENGANGNIKADEVKEILPKKPMKPERKFNSKELIEKQRNWTAHFSKTRSSRYNSDPSKPDIKAVPRNGKEEIDNRNNAIAARSASFNLSAKSSPTSPTSPPPTVSRRTNITRRSRPASVIPTTTSEKRGNDEDVELSDETSLIYDPQSDKYIETDVYSHKNAKRNLGGRTEMNDKYLKHDKSSRDDEDSRFCKDSGHNSNVKNERDYIMHKGLNVDLNVDETSKEDQDSRFIKGMEKVPGFDKHNETRSVIETKTGNSSDYKSRNYSHYEKNYTSSDCTVECKYPETQYVDLLLSTEPSTNGKNYGHELEKTESYLYAEIIKRPIETKEAVILDDEKLELKQDSKCAEKSPRDDQTFLEEKEMSRESLSVASGSLSSLSPPSSPSKVRSRHEKQDQESNEKNNKQNDTKSEIPPLPTSPVPELDETSHLNDVFPEIKPRTTSKFLSASQGDSKSQLDVKVCPDVKKHSEIKNHSAVKEYLETQEHLDIKGRLDKQGNSNLKGYSDIKGKLDTKENLDIKGHSEIKRPYDGYSDINKGDVNYADKYNTDDPGYSEIENFSDIRGNNERLSRSNSEQETFPNKDIESLYAVPHKPNNTKKFEQTNPKEKEDVTYEQIYERPEGRKPIPTPDEGLAFGQSLPQEIKSEANILDLNDVEFADASDEEGDYAVIRTSTVLAEEMTAAEADKLLSSK